MRWIATLVLVATAGCAQVFGIGQTEGACANGGIRCDGVCVDPLTSVDHCGNCETTCAGAEVCANGTCGDQCPIDQPLCNGACSDPMTDAANCGGCGHGCPAGNVCVFGDCQPPCDAASLMAQITDPWGVQWDGLERTAAALDAAQVVCSGFGARLPTATELFRVAANQSGAVGMSFHTNFLWTQTPDDNLNQATIRLSDGTSNSAVATTPQSFRCVCGAALPKTFTGGHCNGDPGKGCFEVNGYNVDTKDRPALRKSAAVAECITEHAHLVDSTILAEAIRAGLPGTNAYVMTADQWVYSSTTQVRWTTGDPAWDPTGNITAVDNRNPSAFRCGATKLAESPNPNQLPNAFVPPQSKYTGETADATAAGWAAAHDACFAKGGHLPRSSELAELIEQGLPNGSNAYLWTSDEVGYNGTQFLTSVSKWMGLDKRHSYAYTGAADQTSTWDYKTTAANAYRCILYPIDPTYVAPTSCNGGCFEVTLPGATSAKMWIDMMDRAATSLGAAFDDCRMQKGHLASERDYTEATRLGLPNGTAAMASPWLWTSDYGQGNLMVVRWTDVDMTFTDQYSTYMTWAGPGNQYRYRCMWTNELR